MPPGADENGGPFDFGFLVWTSNKGGFFGFFSIFQRFFAEITDEASKPFLNKT